MLRVTILETSTEQKFVLEGKLTEPWVSDLESAWNSTREARRGRMCIVDLRDITLVDESGKRILAAMCIEGVRFIRTHTPPSPRTARASRIGSSACSAASAATSNAVRALINRPHASCASARSMSNSVRDGTLCTCSASVTARSSKSAACS